MSYSPEEQQWITFYDKMGDGKVPYCPKFYQIDDFIHPDAQQGSADSGLTLVSPTEAQVNQAKMQLKRKLTATPRPVKRRRINKTKKTKKKPKKKAKKQIKKKQVKKAAKKRPAKRTTKKKNVKRKPKKKYTY